MEHTYFSLQNLKNLYGRKIYKIVTYFDHINELVGMQIIDLVIMQ
jgi:hypothetical protein